MKKYLLCLLFLLLSMPALADVWFPRYTCENIFEGLGSNTLWFAMFSTAIIETVLLFCFKYRNWKVLAYFFLLNLMSNCLLNTFGAMWIDRGPEIPRLLCAEILVVVVETGALSLMTGLTGRLCLCVFMTNLVSFLTGLVLEDYARVMEVMQVIALLGGTAAFETFLLWRLGLRKKRILMPFFILSALANFGAFYITIKYLDFHEYLDFQMWHYYGKERILFSSSPLEWQTWLCEAGVVGIEVAMLSFIAGFNKKTWLSVLLVNLISFAVGVVFLLLLPQVFGCRWN